MRGSTLPEELILPALRPPGGWFYPLYARFLRARDAARGGSDRLAAHALPHRDVVRAVLAEGAAEHVHTGGQSRFALRNPMHMAPLQEPNPFPAPPNDRDPVCRVLFPPFPLAFAPPPEAQAKQLALGFDRKLIGADSGVQEVAKHEPHRALTF
jgi:hypothetical protein